LRYTKEEVQIVQHWNRRDLQPLVTVCCITYNHRSYITDALEGFLSQITNFSFEILVRDDCSTDGTSEILIEYQKKYPNILRLIRENENTYSKGVKPFPVLYKLAKGDFLALCEGDDYWTDPNKLQYQYDSLLKHPQCELCIHPAQVIDIANGKQYRLWDYGDREKIFSTDEIIECNGQFAPTSSYFFRKEVAERLPEWFYKIAPVGDFFIEVFGSVSGGCLYLPRTMSTYRLGHTGSWTSTENVRYSVKNLQYIVDMDASLLYLDNELGHRYKKSISMRRAYLYLSRAEYALFHGNKKMFEESVEKSERLAGDNLDVIKSISIKRCCFKIWGIHIRGRHFLSRLKRRFRFFLEKI